MDTTVTITGSQDTSKYDFAGRRTPVRRYTFYVGKVGPFTEEVDLTNGFDPNAFDRQIQPLLLHLQAK